MPLITAGLTAGLAALTAAVAPAAATTAAAAGLGGAAAAGAAGAGVAAAGGAAAASAAGIAGTLGTIGTIGGLVGTGIQTYAGMQAAEAQAEAEKRRQQMAALTAKRENREALRKAQAARAVGINNQAGALGEISPLVSSAYGGLIGQVEGNLSYEQRAIGQNERITNDIFAANASASSWSGIASVGRGVGSLFGQLAQPNVAAAGGRLGKTIFDSI